MPGDEARTELLLALGDAQGRVGDTDASKATFLEAADLARRSHAAEQLARAALGYGGRFVWLRAGTDTKIIPLLREALAALPSTDSTLRVQLLARLAGARRDESAMELRDEVSAEAVAIAARLGDPATLAYALIARGLAIWGPAAAFELRELAEEAIGLAEIVGQHDHVAAARLIRFQSILATGPAEMVVPALEEYTRAAVELRQPSHRWYSDLHWTVMLLLEGRLDEAEELAEATYAQGLRAQSWDAGAAHLLALSVLRWEQGRLGELEDRLVSARSVYPGYRLFRCLLALACLETGRPDEARALADELVRGGSQTMPLDNCWAFGMTMLAEVISRVGDSDLAALVHDALLPFAHLVGSGGGEVVSGSIHRPLGQLASVQGRTDDAIAHFETARAVHRAYRADIWTTRTDVDEADRARLRRGSDDDGLRAVELLQAAGDVSRRQGWSGLAGRIAELSALVESDSRPVPLPGGLTPREVEVARLVAEGRSNRDIAETFVLSERTVESHVQHILTKLSFTSRAEIAAWAVRTGLDSST